MSSYRLGTTSYIIPDDILPNVRFLAGKVQDIELVLFEVDDGPNNIPSRETIAELAELADAHDLTYTVHLPLDLRLGQGEQALDRSLAVARSVIERTRTLSPWAYVLHLEGKQIRDRDPWVERAEQSLACSLGGPAARSFWRSKTLRTTRWTLSIR